ncbi:hypothetical protein AVEN_198286-1 [Araneus ventricosus]|uniref:Uncharacterized protein n=1 Tax=Araneus ventricosus TaxID=182803 RepID=A0A4Y2VQM4_ARAVE|nr:hypothetical protein AVEN_198286-1 [Araneus ventricosus]
MVEFKIGRDKKNVPTINRRAVFAMRMIGKGEKSLQKFSSYMALPAPVSQESYDKINDKILRATTVVANSYDAPSLAESGQATRRYGRSQCLQGSRPQYGLDGRKHRQHRGDIQTRFDSSCIQNEQGRPQHGNESLCHQRQGQRYLGDHDVSWLGEDRHGHRQSCPGSIWTMIRTLPKLNESHHGTFIDRTGNPYPY